MSGRKKTLSEKISELINPNPAWEDPESEFSETTAKVVENDAEYFDDGDEELQPRSKLKVSHCELLEENDKRYIGKKISRKKFENGNSKLEGLSKVELEHEEDSEDVSEEDGSIDGEMLSEGEASEDEESGSGSEDEEDLEDEEDEGNDSKITGAVDVFKTKDDPLKNILSTDFSEELEKGNAVRNQIRLWDNLLEMRIQMQKCLYAANRFPQHDTFSTFKKDGKTDFRTELNKCKKEGFGFLEKLLDLQKIMLQSYPETKELCSGKTSEADHDDEEIISSEDESDKQTDVNEDEEVPTKRRKLGDYSSVITKQHNDFKGYRNETLEKWYNRSRVCVNNLKRNNFSAFDLSVLKQIDHVLSDQSTLIKRTQKKRSEYRVLGQADMAKVEKDQEFKNKEEYDKEIYDDDDFYHKLLRELIERKSADVSDPVKLGRQWMELEKLRRKLKKKVDTKASKGRKIRYVVHPKLVNFMAPLPNNWSDSAMDDLFRSLFGKTE